MGLVASKKYDKEQSDPKKKYKLLKFLYWEKDCLYFCDDISDINKHIDREF